jgi:RNA polymerase II-associated factor 1
MLFITAIQAPAHTPNVHPHDRPLLRPLSTLGRPKVAEASVSFLRRTEYISSIGAKRAEGGTPRALLASKPRRADKRPAPEPSADSPAAIKRKIDRSFDIVDKSLKSLSDIRHPTNRALKVTDAYPLLPDLDAFPDSGAYVTIKFLNNPSGTTKSSTYDTRLLTGVFRPIEKTTAEETAYEVALAAHERDPNNFPKPPNLMNYDFYLSPTATASENFRKRFDVENPDRDDDSLYTHQSESGPCFQFARLRAYETFEEKEFAHDTKWSNDLILSFNDRGDGISQKAAYYYPVMQRSHIRPQRTKNIARTVGITDEEEQIIDQLDITVEDPTQKIVDVMLEHKRHPYGPELGEAAEDANGGDAERGAQSVDASQTPSDRDAEGDEDE